MMITEKELEKRKDHVIHLAFQLFCQKGINGVTVAEIAAVSNVSETSIYRYFGTKIELVSLTQYVLWGEIVESLLQDIVQDGEYDHRNGLEQIGLLLSGFQRLQQEHEEYVVFSYDYKLFLVQRGLQMLENEYGEITKNYYNAFMLALQKGKADGSIQAKENNSDLFYAMWGLMRGYIAKIAIYNRMYDGKNPWDGRLNIVRAMILSALKNGFELS